MSKEEEIPWITNLRGDTIEMRVDGKTTQFPRDYWIGNVPPAASKEWERIARDINEIVTKTINKDE
jgi:hypothetical protein